jgi:hypothetical protein
LDEQHDVFLLRSDLKNGAVGISSSHGPHLFRKSDYLVELSQSDVRKADGCKQAVDHGTIMFTMDGR